MNTKQGETAKDHVIMVYEAADTLQNVVKCLSKGLRKDMQSVNKTIMEINRQKYLIHMQGIFDLKCQDELLGAQGSSCVLPCSKCLVTKDHLQNHGGREHSKENCAAVLQKKNFKYYEESYKKVFKTTHKKTLEKLEGKDVYIRRMLDVSP